MFKVGDRVTLISLNHCEHGTVVDVPTNYGFIKVWNKTLEKMETWGKKYTIPTEIWESPLYQAMKEN